MFSLPLHPRAEATWAIAPRPTCLAISLPGSEAGRRGITLPNVGKSAYCTPAILAGGCVEGEFGMDRGLQMGHGDSNLPPEVLS